ncbi:PREDICTED: orofacial cleft 1 candidate gene 1 protein [Leptosomus discolor]|uniref:orofacial cleft 1 candidate gene 1 protein n=1 Tax=Leptosomus discolor TaxID=188344 RepID=UPI0005226939|nr:PREDICTED: orofacial cleft 1 candidate gene 1 protein [Leptosomus discolor]
MEELETGEVSGADGFALAPDVHASSHLIGGPGRHCHHRDSNEDSVSKGEEKLEIRKKFQQKALKQTKQKKSKSAEFLMVKEERAATEGIENPAFNISSTDLSAYQSSEEKVIRYDKPDSTLADHQQKLRLQAHAEPRGNEYSRNYFDPLMDEEINPRQCGMEVSEEGEAELNPVKSDEQILYGKLMKLLNEENKMLDLQACVAGEDFPDSVMPVSSSKACDLHRELEDEEIPSYIEQFESNVQDDIILLGSFSLEQLYASCIGGGLGNIIQRTRNEGENMREKDLDGTKSVICLEGLMDLDNAGVMMRSKRLAMCTMVYAIEKKHLGLFQCGELVLAAAGTGPLCLREHISVGQLGRNNLTFSWCFPGWLQPPLDCGKSHKGWSYHPNHTATSSAGADSGPEPAPNPSWGSSVGVLPSSPSNCYRVGSQPLKAEDNRCEEETVASFGNFAGVNIGLNGAAGSCGKVDCSKTPQPIEIHIKCLRGVKDKVPKGHYTLKVSVCGRLGSGLLEWPKLKEQPQARTTLPVSHNGNFYNTEIYFGQSIQTVLPPRKAVKPGMVFLFELFLLGGTCTWIDREVGWGAFPLCDNNFNTLEGKFKCPFLRGHYDIKVDRFKKIEDFISQDLDHWLCNLYFQVIKLPQDSDKQSKCDTYLHLPPELLVYSSAAEKNGVSEKVEQSGPQGQPLTSLKDPDTHRGSIPTVVKEVEKQFNAAKGGEVCVTEEAGRKRDELKMLPAEDDFYQDCCGSADGQCGSFQPKGVQGGHHKYADVQIFVLLVCTTGKNKQVEEGWMTSSGVSTSLRFLEKFNWNNPPDQRYQEKSDPGNNASPEEEQASVESSFYMEELEKYTFSVCCRSAAEVKLSRRIIEHFHFVVYAAFSELGAARWCSRDFWLLVLLVVLLWFMRLYLHYLSQWLFLQSISIPVTKFQLFPHTVELCYQNSLLQTSEELVMVVVGPLTLNAGLLLMILIRWGCQQLFDSFPSFLSKFIIAMGLWTVLDPLAVFVVDSFLGRLGNGVEKPIADAAKLYWVFLRAEESGIPGALITVVLYTILFIISSTVLYLYFLRLHSEGWLLDVFHRIHGEEGTFFVPLDLEISSQELSYIMKRAEQWRGINGERRVVSDKQSL